MYILVLKQLIIMMFIALVGFIFAKKFKVTEAEQKFISKMLLYLVNPFLIINSFNKEFRSEKLKQLVFIFLVSIILHIVMIIIGLCVTHTKKDNLKLHSHLERLGIIFTNCGFIGIPLIRGVFGDEGVFYLMGYLLVYNIFFWTYGFYEITGSINLKKIITNPNIICVILGIILFCMPFTLQEQLAKTVAFIADMNTALAMILIGVLLANFKLPESSNSQGYASLSGKNYVFHILKVVFMRLFVCSFVNVLIMYFVYKLFGNVIQDCRTMLFVALICSMCPCGTNIPSLASISRV